MIINIIQMLLAIWNDAIWLFETLIAKETVINVSMG